jgi:hypothetical protein
MARCQFNQSVRRWDQRLLLSRKLPLHAGSRLLPSGQASLIATLETPLMPFWVWLAFHELPTPRALIGGSLVMGAIVADIISDNWTRARSGAASNR